MDSIRSVSCGPATPAGEAPVALGAIDVGTNAARLKLAHLYPDGRLVPFYKQRAPIRPGEGVFAHGELAPPVVERLVETLCQFMEACREHGAQVRAVATSSLRDARNAAAVQARVLAEAGVRLEVISGREEARLICLGVLDSRPPDAPALVIDIGGGSTEVILARGDAPLGLWSLPLGTVRLTELFHTARRVTPKRLAAVRAHARAVLREGLTALAVQTPPPRAYGSSGTIQALAGFVGPHRSRIIDCALLSEAAESLAGMKMRQRRRVFVPGRADIIVAGAVILEAVTDALGLTAMEAVDAGLRDGLLVALKRDRTAPIPPLALMRLPDAL